MTATTRGEWDVTVQTSERTAFVAVQVQNHAPVPRRVRVRNRLDGPVLPPRRRGVPEPGWTDDGFEGVVPANGRRALGFACQAPARTPPVDVEWIGRAESADCGEQTPRDLMRRLGSPAPPRDAIPRSAVETEAEEARQPEMPPPVRDWFESLERRIARREQLTSPAVSEATAALDALGGLESATALAESGQADLQLLTTVARRVEELRERQAATNVPTESLRALAGVES